MRVMPRSEARRNSARALPCGLWAAEKRKLAPGKSCNWFSRSAREPGGGRVIHAVGLAELADALVAVDFDGINRRRTQHDGAVTGGVHQDCDVAFESERFQYRSGNRYLALLAELDQIHETRSLSIGHAGDREIMSHTRARVDLGPGERSLGSPTCGKLWVMGSLGRVEDGLTPALPHQTVHAIFPQTACRCSSRQGMRRVPARFRRNLVQLVAPVEMSTWKLAEASSSVLHLMTLHQMDSQPVSPLVMAYLQNENQRET